MKNKRLVSGTISINRFCIILFSLGVFFLPLNNLKIGARLPSICIIFINNENALSMYFFLAFGILYFFYKWHKKELYSYKSIFIFYCIYILASLITHIHGLVISPYLKNADYSLLSSSNLVMFNLVKSIFHDISDFHTFAIISTLKQIISNTTFFSSTFFTVFSFYLFYKETGLDFMHHIWIAVISSVALILIYEVIEFLHVIGMPWAKEAVKKVFSLLYDVRSSNGWWPPEIQSQIRSVFPEASFFSYWGSAVLLVLIYGIQKENKTISIIEYFGLSFALFATDSRTATALVFGGLIAFCLISLFINIKRYWKVVSIVIVISIISLLLAILFLNNTSSFKWQNASPAKIEQNEEIYSSISMDNKIEEKQSTISKYFDSTVISLTQKNARSNNSRYGMIESQINIFKKHPILGVGKEFVGFYEINHFPDYTADNDEIKIWIQEQANSGPFTSVLPKLNEYFYTLAYSGILGFLVFSGPFIFFTATLFVQILRWRNKIKDQHICCLSLCAVIIAFGISNGWMENYIYILVFSMAFLMVNEFLEKNTNLTE